MKNRVRCTLKSLINKMKLYFLCFGVFNSSFPANSDEIYLWQHLKTNWTVLKFFLLTVFWYSTSCTVIIVFRKISAEPVNPTARSWFCWCWKRFWKIWFLRNAYMCWSGAKMSLRLKWRNEGNCFPFTASLLLPCICECGCIVSWNEFFSSVGQVADWNFLVLQWCVNVCKGVPGFDHGRNHFAITW